MTPERQARPGPRTSRFDLRFAGACALLLVAEALCILLLTGSEYDRIVGGDGPEYVRYARNLVDNGVFSRAAAAPYDPSIYRTPGYPFFLAGLRLFAGDSLLIVRVTQFLLVGVLACLVYGTASKISDRRTARVAAVFALTYLPFLWLARMHLTEVLTSVLVAAVIYMLVSVRVDPERALPTYLAIGAIAGLASMVRPIYGLAAFPIAAAMLIWPGKASRRRSTVFAAVMLVGFALVLVPWTIRNAAITHDVRPFGAGGGGLSLFASAQQHAGIADYRFGASELNALGRDAAPFVAQAYRRAEADPASIPLSVRRELEVETALRAEAREIIADTSPFDALSRLPKRLVYLWAVSDYPPASQQQPWRRLAQAQHVLIFALALLGALALIRRRGLAETWPLLLFPVYVTCAHVLLHSEARYSVPVRSPLLVCAAVGAWWLWDALRSRRVRTRIADPPGALPTQTIRP
jgi:4-amino-4-deoxy-L-arabinose transferase-like glycosyltransferase